MEDRGNGTEDEEKGLHPFEVFPEELWPEIIEKLEDSSEILRVMEAIPEIKDIMESRKRWWLFDQVIPHVSQWLEQADLLSCRQVCKLWSHGMDNLLENHPQHRAYNPEEPVTGQVWLYDMVPSCMSSRNYLHAMHFNGHEKIISVLQEMESHPKERSPIVGRAVHIFSQRDMEVLSGATEFFRSFGQHVWVLTLEDYVHTDPIPFSNSIREWITLLPNLKNVRLQMSLRNRNDVLNAFLNVTYVDDDEEFFAKADDDTAAVENGAEAKKIPEKSSAKEDAPAPDPWMGPLPPLPHLETLQFHFDTLPPSMVNALMSSYSLQIRRLWFPLRYWKPEYSNMFPNLTELSIEFIYSKPRLIHILLNLQAPLLYELELWLTDTDKLDVETEILPWLKRFPLIRNLSLLSGPPLPGGKLLFDPERDSVPSLKYLVLSVDYVHANSGFLLCFPNLEYLEFGDSQDPEGEAFEPILKLWGNILDRTVYESNVWELMPKLRVITYTDPDSDWDAPDVRFTRETYEHRKKISAGANRN